MLQYRQVPVVATRLSACVRRLPAVLLGLLAPLALAGFTQMWPAGSPRAPVSQVAAEPACFVRCADGRLLPTRLLLAGEPYWRGQSVRGGMVLTPHYPGVRAGKDVCLTAVRAQGADWVIDGGPQTYAWHRVGDTLVVDFIHCVPGPSVQVPAPAHLELLTQSPYPVTRLTWPLTGAFALSAGPPFTVRLGEVPPFPSKGFQSGVPIIVLDPGHGGADPGAIAANGLEEKTVTLTMARKLQAALEARGWRVLMTRTTDQEMRPEAKDAEELGARVALADAPQVRAFVSLHCDESSCGSATGATVHWSKPMDRPLADALGQDLNLPDYSIDRSPFYVLRHAAVPSVLIELGYLSTRMDAARLAQDGYCTGLATHLADSLTRWLRTADRLQPVVSDPPDSTVAGK